MKRGISFLIAGTIVLTISSGVLANELDNAKKNLNNVNSSINEKKEQLEEVKKDKADAEKQVKALDERINSTTRELDKLKKEMSTLDNEIKQLGSDILKKQQEIDEEQALLDRRVSAIYKSGSASYMSVLLGSRDLSELLERAEFIRRIIDYDKRLIEGLQTNKTALELKKASVEKKKAEVTELKRQSDVKYATLKNANEEKRKLVQTLEKDKASIERIIAQEEADARALKERIKKLEASFKQTNGKMFCVTGRPYVITSPYGSRMHPVLGYPRFHHGIDIGVPWGTPLYSLMDGIVIFAGAMGGYGNVVMINHGNITSLYAHNSRNVVKEGQVVKGGQLIAYSGNTGISSGPHLHFEIRKPNGETIDPLPYYVR
jgi:murein DD-endopeptidase MepM/ murein hydrolase activator NlpD